MARAAASAVFVRVWTAASAAPALAEGHLQEAIEPQRDLKSSRVFVSLTLSSPADIAWHKNFAGRAGVQRFQLHLVCTSCGEDSVLQVEGVLEEFIRGTKIK